MQTRLSLRSAHIPHPLQNPLLPDMRLTFRVVYIMLSQMNSHVDPDCIQVLRIHVPGCISLDWEKP
jgi:hypothetical protein